MVRILDDTTEAKPAAPTCDITCGCCTADAQYTPQEPQECQIENPAAGIVSNCPICDAPLTSLDADIIIHRTAQLTKDGLDEIIDDVVMQVFKCPDCGTILCDDEDEARCSVF